ncbi:class I SAM-dependent methyltransferase, partial [Streptomyces californicus]|uniref:class I SAM-dependent methyltransferase n=1 Tax=Streptomyces californicus TaxID=67351 RepID=UPI0036C02B42
MTTIDWDAAAQTFDQEPDHGLLDPAVRDAWAGRLESWLPATRGDVLDLGCGTGSLSLLAAGQGHRVTAVGPPPPQGARGPPPHPPGGGGGRGRGAPPPPPGGRGVEGVHP